MDIVSDKADKRLNFAHLISLPSTTSFKIQGCDVEIRESLTYFLTIASLNL